MASLLDAHPSRSVKICFVLGSCTGGSLNSRKYYPSPIEQALLLLRSGHQVSMLEVSDSVAPLETRVLHWREKGLESRTLPADAAKETEPFYPDLLELSWRTYHWLRQQDFDCIVFEDSSSTSLMAIQAKKLGESFAATTLVYHLHGPEQWSAHLRDRRHLVQLDVVLPYSQQYAVENADVVVLPADYFSDRIRSAGWRPGGAVVVLPYLTEQITAAPASRQIWPRHGASSFPYPIPITPAFPYFSKR